MMSRFTLRQLRQALGVAGAVVAFTACSTEEPGQLGTNPNNGFALGIDLSSTSAAVGDQVALAVRADNAGDLDLGALQGTLRFDPSRLSFVGQAGDAAGPVTMVNDKAADRGSLRFLSYSIQGLGHRGGTLVFQVKSVDYARGLGFDLELASDRKGLKEIRQAGIAGVEAAVDLAVPADAHRMALADWNEALYPGQVAAELAALRAAPQLQPTIANEVYGNANLSAETGYCGPPGGPFASSVNGLDVLYMANLSVGNSDITGSDFPTRDPIIVSNVSPAPSASQPIVGLNANGSRTVDGLDVLAVANENAGSLRPVVCDVVPNITAPAGNIVTITGNIATSRTLTRDSVYRLDGIVRVTGGATLTVLPGTRIEGMRTSTSGTPSALYIERDGFIVAIGQPQAPIVFTCDQTPKFKGCWGGVVVLGNAAINGGQGSAANTSATSPVIAGRAATGNCLEQDYEGSGPNPLTLARFGGCNNADSSGVIKFARFEYGGFQFQANRELNNLTMGGVGSGTDIDFVQVHGGLDDGYEIFGGTHNVRHLVSTANSDDAFDFSQGWSGNAQFIIIQQDTADADKGFEIDNSESPQALNLTPATTGPTANITFIGKQAFGVATGPNTANDVEGAITLRRGANPPMFNQVIMGFPQAMDLDDVDGAGNPTCGADIVTNVPWTGVLVTDLTRVDNSDTEAQCPPFVQAPAISMEDEWFATVSLGNATAAGAGTTILRDPYNRVTPDFRPVSAAAVAGGVTPIGTGFDATATYRGAINPSSNVIPWYLPWSRGFTSATAP